MPNSFLMDTSITILTELGKGIGFGHYTRCSSLLEAFQELGYATKMIAYSKQFLLKDTSVQVMDWLENVDKISPESQKDIAIVDSYLASEDTYLKLKMNFRNVVVIDDYNRISYPADLLVNPNVFFEEINYSNQAANCVGGKDYVILRKEFRESSIDSSINDKIDRILITVGGSDFRVLLPRLIDVCSKTPVEQIDVIAPEGLNDRWNNGQINILGAQDAHGMVNLMLKADLVISACGQTLHELVALAKPTLGICLDIDQVPNQRYYLKAQFLKHDLVWDDEELNKKLAQGISDFQNKESRLSTVGRARKLINRNGIETLVKAITHLQHE